MGDRLNIEIEENGVVLANAYYNWSGYTSSSLELISQILKNVKKIDYKDRIVNAIKLLETTGAYMTEDEIEYAKLAIEDYYDCEFQCATDNDEGVIAISEDEMELTEESAPFRVGIDLTNEIIDFNVFYECDKEEFEECYDEDYDTIPSCNFDLNIIPFNRFKKIKKLIINLTEKEEYCIKIDGTENVVVFIE